MWLILHQLFLAVIINQQLLNEFPALHSEKPIHLPKHNVVHRIRATGGPVYCRPQCLSPHIAASVKPAFAKLLANGIISVSCSPWCCPLHCVPEKDDSWRSTGDYRPLNNLTVADTYPLPHLQSFTDQLHGKMIFSKIDLMDAFLQIPVHPDNVPKTTITTPFGAFQYHSVEWPQWSISVISTIYWHGPPWHHHHTTQRRSARHQCLHLYQRRTAHKQQPWNIHAGAACSIRAPHWLWPLHKPSQMRVWSPLNGIPRSPHLQGRHRTSSWESSCHEALPNTHHSQGAQVIPRYDQFLDASCPSLQKHYCLSMTSSKASMPCPKMQEYHGAASSWKPSINPRLTSPTPPTLHTLRLMSPYILQPTHRTLQSPQYSIRSLQPSGCDPYASSADV